MGKRISGSRIPPFFFVARIEIQSDRGLRVARPMMIPARKARLVNPTAWLDQIVRRGILLHKGLFNDKQFGAHGFESMNVQESGPPQYSSYGPLAPLLQLPRLSPYTEYSACRIGPHSRANQSPIRSRSVLTTTLLASDPNTPSKRDNTYFRDNSSPLAVIQPGFYRDIVHCFPELFLLSILPI